MQQTPLVRVYRQSLPRTENQMFACSLRTGRRVRLGVTSGDMDWDVRHIRTVGQRVAWWQTECGDDECASYHVVSADLSSRRAKPVRIPSRGRVYDLELAPAGGVSWIALTQWNAATAPPTYSVWTSDGSGTVERATDGVARTSLAISGSRLYWTDRAGANALTLRGAARR